jgi:hypothetical protein
MGAVAAVFPAGGFTKMWGRDAQADLEKRRDRFFKTVLGPLTHDITVGIRPPRFRDKLRESVGDELQLERVGIEGLGQGVFGALKHNMELVKKGSVGAIVDGVGEVNTNVDVGNVERLRLDGFAAVVVSSPSRGFSPKWQMSREFCSLSCSSM